MIAPLSLERYRNVIPIITGEPDELRLLVDTLLNEEIRALHIDDSTRWMLHTQLRGAIVEIVVNTLERVQTHDTDRRMN